MATAATGVDLEVLGERLRSTRKKRGLTLQQVSEATGVSVATLSRIERKDLKDLESKTLMRVTEWLGTQVEVLASPRASEPEKSTPDIVDLHLRADKNLDKAMAIALSNLFRAAYEQVARRQKRG
jgi:transcriptional regulator with XRE-family HTH domain